MDSDSLTHIQAVFIIKKEVVGYVKSFLYKYENKTG